MNKLKQAGRAILKWVGLNLTWDGTKWVAIAVLRWAWMVVWVAWWQG